MKVLSASVLLAVSLIPGLAVAAPGDQPPDQDEPNASPAEPEAAPRWQRPVRGCGTHQIQRQDAPPPRQSFAAGEPRVIYMNKDGGTYTFGGTTDASTNIAGGVSVGPSSGTIPALNTNQFDWGFISQCVQDYYAPYNVTFTETEPASGDYIEAVVGGTGTELGYGTDELFGIAAADDFCSVTERGIAFSFSQTHLGVPQADEELCATIAHELGHVMALEHEALAIDLMSYVLVSESASKDFVDQDANCGVYPGDNFSCSCGGSQTNSAQRLEDYLGLRPAETNPPILAITSPDDGATVPPTFTIAATATDDTSVTRVEFYVDGLGVGNDSSAAGDAYSLTVEDLDAGEHELSVIARDPSGNEATATRTITVASGCDACADGSTDYVCVEGECLLADGQGCTDDVQCANDLCFDDGDAGTYCTSTCDLLADACGQGFDCTDDGTGDGVCTLNGDPLPGDGDDGGGCCQSSRGSGAGAMGLGLMVGAVLVRRRRRR